ncbi:MAG: adenylate/guanylate cyclase domain-containing protein [Pseudomonadota bacterium]
MSKQSKSYSVAKPTVLLTDDDRTTRLIVSNILDSLGYAYTNADCGEKCLFLALENTFDAILIDINMPGLSGIELCQHLRDKDRYKTTPIIFVTTDQDESVFEEAFAAGASDFIYKPVNPTVLAARLKSHLDRKKYFDELEKTRKYLNRYISLRTQRLVEAYSMSGLLPSPERHNVCVMFTDIRDFTKLSHSCELENLFSMVSEVLGAQVDLVYKYNGYIDKFGGDGLMAIFDGDDCVKQACLCAQQILNSLYSDSTRDDQEPLRVGIGIDYGSVIIGNIGSQEHLDYSALGETVNLAARLCANSESMQILVSNAVIEELTDENMFSFSNAEQLTIKGFDHLVSVSTLDKTS